MLVLYFTISKTSSLFSREIRSFLLNSYFTGLLLCTMVAMCCVKNYFLPISLCCFYYFLHSISFLTQRQQHFTSIVCLIIILNAVVIVFASSSYDSIECDPHSNRARAGRARLIESIPCDLSKQSYCNLPGESYPW